MAGVQLAAVSFATYTEVLATGHASNWGPSRLDALRAKMRPYVVLPYSLSVAEIWASVSPKVRGHLHKGGVNDVWTAACALAQQPPLPVVTNNLSDFESIARHRSDLRVLNPVRPSASG